MISMKALIVEGRYDSLVTSLSRTLLGVIKSSHAAVTDPRGRFAGKRIYFAKGQRVPNILDDAKFRHIFFEEVENQTIPVEFYLALKVQWVEGLGDFRYGGDAYNENAKQADTPPLIEIRFEIDPADYPQRLTEVAMHLRDILRHEIEHVTQSGWNTISSKYLPSDQSVRQKIESGQLPPARYFMLPKEIPAMLHGLYTKAKKSKQPLRDVISSYLQGWVDAGMLTATDKQTILQTWRQYLPKLAIRQEI